MLNSGWASIHRTATRLPSRAAHRATALIEPMETLWSPPMTRGRCPSAEGGETSRRPPRPSRHQLGMVAGDETGPATRGSRGGSSDVRLDPRLRGRGRRGPRRALRSARRPVPSEVPGTPAARPKGTPMRAIGPRAEPGAGTISRGRFMDRALVCSDAEGDSDPRSTGSRRSDRFRDMFAHNGRTIGETAKTCDWMKPTGG